MILVCLFVVFLMVRRQPRSTQSRSSAASDVYKRQFQGQFSKAIEDINKSIELDPKSPDAYNIRGMVYAQIGNPRAISDFQKVCDMGHAQGCSNWQRILKSR